MCMHVCLYMYKYAKALLKWYTKYCILHIIILLNVYFLICAIKYSPIKIFPCIMQERSGHPILPLD